MKKINLLIAIAIIIATTTFTVQHANAKAWRVNNNSNFNGTSQFGENFGGTVNYPVFKQINSALTWSGSSSVQDNDTLYIEGTNTIYATANITKKLVIIGPGYFLTDNSNTSVYPYSAKIERVNFNAGSDSSQVIGMDIVGNGTTSTGEVWITVNNITVKRCRIENTVAFETNLYDAYILQNFFSNTFTSSNALGGNGTTNFNPPSGLYFNNNIVKNKLIWRGTTSQYQMVQCNHNVFDGPANTLLIDLGTSQFRNNIVKPTGATVNINNNSNTTVSYVTCINNSQFPGTPNVIVEPVMTNVFQSSTSSDGQYQLKSTWATAHSGSDGDRGAFGASTVTKRYTLSGLPAIPVVYDIETTGVASQSTGLKVTIKARTIK